VSPESDRQRSFVKIWVTLGASTAETVKAKFHYAIQLASSSRIS